MSDCGDRNIENQRKQEYINGSSFGSIADRIKRRRLSTPLIKLSPATPEQGMNHSSKTPLLASTHATMTPPSRNRLAPPSDFASTKRHVCVVDVSEEDETGRNRNHMV